MNIVGKKITFINWITLAIFNIYLLLAYTSSKRFDLLLSRGGLFTSCILLILFFNNINFIQALKNKEKELLLCIIIGILAIINMFLCKSGPGVIFDIANITLILYLSDKIKLDTISRYIISVPFFLILLAWTSIDGEGYNYNTISLIVLEATLLSSLGFSSLLGKWKKEWLIYLYLMISIVVLVYPIAKKYEGRTELGALFIFLFFFFIVPKAIYQFKKTYLILLGIIASACMIIPAIFTHMYYRYIEQGLELPSLMRILHGREPVWNQYFNAWKKEPWTGIGNNFIEKIPDLSFTSAHNGFLHLLVIYGIFVFLIVFIYLGYKLFQLKTDKLSLTQKLGLSLIIAMFMIAAMESYLFTSFSNMFLFFVFLILFNENNQTE